MLVSQNNIQTVYPGAHDVIIRSTGHQYRHIILRVASFHRQADADFIPRFYRQHFGNSLPEGNQKMGLRDAKNNRMALLDKAIKRWRS